MRIRRRHVAAWALAAAVPLAFLSVFFALPVSALVLRGFAPEGVLDLSGFGEVFSRPRTWRIVGLTVGLGLAGTFFSVLLGVPGAYVLYRRTFRGQRVVRAFVTIPFVLPTVVVGVAFRALLAQDGPLGFLGLDRTIPAIVLALVFFNYAIVVRTVGGLWERLDPRTAQAARALGASAARAFWSITLPALTPAIASAAAVVFLFCSTAFGVVLVLGGIQYGTIETEIWIQTTQFLNLRAAAVLSVLQLVVVVGGLLVFSRARSKREAALALHGIDHQPRPLRLWVPPAVPAHTDPPAPTPAAPAPTPAAASRGRERPVSSRTTAQTVDLDHTRRPRGQPGGAPAATRARPARWTARWGRPGADLPVTAATAVVILGLLALPLGTLVARSLRTPTGWGLGNYLALGSTGGPNALTVTVWEAAGNSLRVALDATIIAVVVGTLVALVVSRRPRSRHGRRAVSVLDAVFMLPLGVSAVTVGFGFLITLNRPPLDLRTSMILIPIAQAVVAIPMVVRTVLPVLRAIDPRLREAAAVLGGSPGRVLAHVDGPYLVRSLGLAIGFAFAISLGEFGATAFLARPDAPTLPVVIFRLIGRPGAENYGMALAASVLLALLTAIIMGVAERLRSERTGEF